MTSSPFDIPREVRDTAERSVEQAKQAFDQFLEATEKAMTTTEGATKAVSQGAADVNRQTIAAVEENLAATFDLAQRIAQARTIEEMIALQQEFLRLQAAAIARQGQDVAKAMTKMASDTAETAKK